MTKISRFNAAFFLALFLLFGYAAAQAQAPSLAASDQYVVTVDTEEGEQTFTIIRDGRIEEQFYYLPIRPTVASTEKDGKKSPVFQLTSYQTKNKNDELVQGGILQLSMVMGVAKKTREEILKKIKRKFIFKDYSKQHRLSPMPIKSAQLSLYDMGGDILDQVQPKGGVAPIFGTQHYPFMLKLKDLGADMMEELCRNKGGLPVLITYTFSGMTPKVGFEVEVDWDACYKHFSTDTNVGIDVAKNALSGGLGLDITTLREEFESKGLIKITSLSDENFSAEQLDELMSPVLNLITIELFEQIHPPESITPAAAKELKKDVEKSPSAQTVQAVTEAALKATKRFFNAKAQVNFALKDVKIVKKGKFTYKFHRQSIVDRTSSFGGLLGIGEYPKKVQDECITTMPAGNWEAAYYILPAIGDPDTLGIRTVSISVTPEEKSGSRWKQIQGQKIESAIFNKNGDQKWTDKNGKEVSRFLFPLKALYAKEGFKEENYHFKIETTITPVAGKSTSTVTYNPVFDGDLPMAPPSDLVDVLTIDGCCLTFGQDEGEVFKVVGMLTAGRSSWRIILDQDNYVANFMIPADEKVIKATSMKFAGKKGMLGSWTQAGKNLRQVEPSLQFLLFDYDWEEELPAEDKLEENALISNPMK
jgi:hypothetical protein